MSSLLQGSHLLCLSCPQQRALHPLNKHFLWLDLPTFPPLSPHLGSQRSHRLDRLLSSPLSQVRAATVTTRTFPLREHHEL